MAKTKAPAVFSAGASGMVQQVSGNRMPSMASSAQVFHQRRTPAPQTDRNQISKPWQREAYRHTNICGEARYASTLFAAIAGRAEIGVSKPQSLANKASWVTAGPEVEAFAELAASI